MTIRSYLASLVGLAVVANPASGWAQGAPAPSYGTPPYAAPPYAAPPYAAPPYAAPPYATPPYAAPPYAPPPYAPPPYAAQPYGTPPYAAPPYAAPTYAQPGRVFPYRDGWPVPVGYHVESRPNKGLLWSGVGIFAGFYGTALLGASNNDSASQWLFVPIAGPLLFASHRQCQSPCDDMGTGPLMFMLSAGQATGAALFIAAFLVPKRWIVPDIAADDGRARFAILPRADRTGSGLVAVGDF